MSEERLEHSIALVLARWMGGENLREATEEVAELARSYFESDEEISFRLTEEMIAQNEKEDMMFLMIMEDLCCPKPEFFPRLPKNIEWKQSPGFILP